MIDHDKKLHEYIFGFGNLVSSVLDQEILFYILYSYLFGFTC